MKSINDNREGREIIGLAGVGIRTKFLGILLIVFILFTANLLITLNIINTKKQDALLINLAGKQRMLSQRILRLTNQILLERKGIIEESGSRYVLTNINTERALFNMTQNAFGKGGNTLDSAGKKVYVERIKSEAAQEALRVVNEKWHIFIENVDDILKSEIFSEENLKTATTSFKQIEAVNLLPSIDRVVTILEREAKDRIKLLHNIQIVTFPIGLLAFLFAIIYLNAAILKPIKNLVYTIMEIGKGDTLKRVNVRSRDEVGFLAESFNTMMDNLEETTVSMDFLDSVLNAICESLIVTNRDREIKMVNPATLEIIGIENENEILGTKIDDIASSSNSLKRDKSLFRPETFMTLLDQGFIRDYNVNYRRKTGEDIPVSFSARILKDKDGGFSGLVCVARDMRGYIELQAQLIQASKLSALGTMSAGMAHELKNPLTTVRGRAEFIAFQLKEGTIPEKALLAEDMDAIIADSDRMANIVDHLRDFSRQSKPEDWGHLDIKAVINDALILLNKQLEQKDIIVVKEIDDNLPPVWGDRNKLISVFQNLVLNASDAFYMVNGREKIVRISAAPIDHNRLKIVFQDNASGMEKDVLRNIFNPFFTTKEAGKGTGLGLSILYGIIEEHGGKVDVSSIPGEGTTFTITMPVGKRK